MLCRESLTIRASRPATLRVHTETAAPPAGSEIRGDFSVKFLVIVNDSPWGSGLALAAFRFVRAVKESGEQVPAVFFREDGIYNALETDAVDAGTTDLSAAWTALANTAGIRMLLCRSSWQRRLASQPGRGFEESGITEMIEQMLQCDRVVTF
jgi:sulfur relay protein TusD/DsrE